MAKGQKTGGRRKGTPNKVTREISELAKAMVPESIQELGRLAKEAVSETARVSAIGMILDRAYGKPSQAISHSGAVGSYDLTRVSDADLKRLESILGPAVTGSNTGGD